MEMAISKTEESSVISTDLEIRLHKWRSLKEWKQNRGHSLTRNTSRRRILQDDLRILFQTGIWHLYVCQTSPTKSTQSLHASSSCFDDCATVRELIFQQLIVGHFYKSSAFAVGSLTICVERNGFVVSKTGYIRLHVRF